MDRQQFHKEQLKEIINGKYRVDGGMMTGGFPGMIRVMDHLVGLESKKTH